jgi:hypothetical protein
MISPGFGSASLHNSQGDIIRLSKVLYLPGAVNGLHSVDILALRGADVVLKSKNRVALVQVSDKTILDTKAGTGYAHKASLVPPSSISVENGSSSLFVLASSTRTSTGAPRMTWHRRYRDI